MRGTWEAPVLVPDCSPMVPSLPCLESPFHLVHGGCSHLICSSVKFLSFLVAILGPMAGPVYSGCFWVARPREKRQSTT